MINSIVTTEDSSMPTVFVPDSGPSGEGVAPKTFKRSEAVDDPKRLVLRGAFQSHRPLASNDGVEALACIHALIGWA